MNAQKDLNCNYCHNDIALERWNSEWDDEDDNHHYKSIACNDCGKKNWLKMDFHGSGDDDSLNKEEKSIDSLIRKVQEGD